MHLAAAFQTLTEELLTRTVQRKIAAENPKGRMKARPLKTISGFLSLPFRVKFAGQISEKLKFSKIYPKFTHELGGSQRFY